VTKVNLEQGVQTLNEIPNIYEQFNLTKTQTQPRK